jgi:hypothetical protein
MCRTDHYTVPVPGSGVNLLKIKLLHDLVQPLLEKVLLVDDQCPLIAFGSGINWGKE